MTQLKDRLYKVFTRLHLAVFLGSKGRLFGRAMGMPIVGLQTIGRRSGQRRTTTLAAPIVEDDRVVLVASFGGDERHPAWYHNLRANPAVQVTLRGRTRPLMARTATGTERSALWERIVAVYDGYGRYQDRTDRQIPVVVLEPEPPAA
ncbi:nitroreductase family deazaflavin-dependent oxidoreductase [Kribbella pratensis]|uniref:Deazaflavin-dependent oxidoreductase (Nitroreductase family) n=1 Tax=Kribbella pratensis TaxID=2512112 RepID=A0A4R8CMA3_9ACTN|nr:nitroreductase family deazaflavin-dependent oxidoreductase [Kribbella pratensis]TDW77206.1 deazaflavin-dependent oxidoreductase (nitroreductase family) [Kribbella pratensis]